MDTVAINFGVCWRLFLFLASVGMGEEIILCCFGWRELITNCFWGHVVSPEITVVATVVVTIVIIDIVVDELIAAIICKSKAVTVVVQSLSC